MKANAAAIDCADGTVRIGYLQSLLDYLDNHQFDKRNVADADLLARIEKSSLDVRVPISTWGELLNKAIQVSGDPQLPLRVADQLLPKHWGMFAYMVMSCKTLADTAAILQRYEKLIDEVNDTRLMVCGDKVHLQWIPIVSEPCPAFMQISLASWVAFARRYTLNNHLVADVHFTHPEPAQTDYYHKVFGGEVLFDQEVTQLIFPLSYLQLPVTHHNEEINRLLISQADHQIESLRNDSQVLQEVRQAIKVRLHKGRVTLEQIADEVDMSPRNLQYKLEVQGTTFQALLNDTRLEMARFYLQDPAMTLAEVAFLLGFSEQSPFTKAFKKWSGETPGEYRKRAERLPATNPFAG